MSGENLDCESWDAGLVRLCQGSALPSGQYWNVAGVPGLSDGANISAVRVCHQSPEAL